MDLSVKTEWNGVHAVLYVQGEIDAYTASKLSDQLTPLVLNSSNRSVTINLQEVTYMDSTGVGIFIGALKASKKSGCQLLVQHVPARIDRLFQITGLKEILTVLPPKGENAE